MASRSARPVTLFVAGIALLVGAAACSSDAGTHRPGGSPGSQRGDTPAVERVLSALAYASVSPTQTLDLYLPAGDGQPSPVVVLIHGGAFMVGSSEIMFGKARTLVTHGYAVAALNYRLSGEALFPAGAQDVKAAVRWLRAQAEKYRLDATRIAAWGESAGGWMSSMLGVTGDQSTIFDDLSLGNTDQSSAVQAVISWFAPSNFVTMDAQAARVTACAGRAQKHGSAGTPESKWLGAAVSDSPRRSQTNLAGYAAAATLLPPFSLAHGDADCQVPLGQSQEFKAALEARGAQVSLTVVPGAGHDVGLFNNVQTEPALAFLDANLRVQSTRSTAARNGN